MNHYNSKNTTQLTPQDNVAIQSNSLIFHHVTRKLIPSQCVRSAFVFPIQQMVSTISRKKASWKLWKKTEKIGENMSLEVRWCEYATPRDDQSLHFDPKGLKNIKILNLESSFWSARLVSTFWDTDFGVFVKKSSVLIGKFVSIFRLL